MQQSLKLLIVEDHELARNGLCLSLDGRDGIQVVGDAENGLEGLVLAQQFHPDIILMDIGMPVKNGIETTQQIKTLMPDVKVVMLTSHESPQEVFDSLKAGASAYCLKTIGLEQLSQVFSVVMKGGIWLDAKVAELVIAALPSGKGHAHHRGGSDLTDRENQVLEMIVAGKSNKEIAQLLNVSSHTAKAHVCNIIQKLAVDDRTQVAVKALTEGLVPNHHHGEDF
jgi:NarL family two-component system response regulator LiaR